MVIAVFLVAFIGIKSVLATNGNIGTNQKIISTTGNASIEVAPDTAYVNIGVVAEDKDLAKAEKEVNSKMQEIVKELKSLGIDEKDIRTLGISINPKYAWNESTKLNVVSGYSVSNMIEIKIKNINQAGNLLSKVVNAGGNRIAGLRFDLEDKFEYYDLVLEKAVEDAKRKALTMGKPFKALWLNPVKISEVKTNFVPYLENDVDTIRKATSTIDSMPINPGTVKVEATVNVDFSF